MLAGEAAAAAVIIGSGVARSTLGEHGVEHGAGRLGAPHLEAAQAGVQLQGVVEGDMVKVV